MDLGGSPPKPRWPEQSGSPSANVKQCRLRQATAEHNSQPSGLLCGEHKLLAAGKQLEEAWLAVQFRLDLKLGYLPDLPPCRQIFKVDPAGVVIFADPGTSAIPSR